MKLYASVTLDNDLSKFGKYYNINCYNYFMQRFRMMFAASMAFMTALDSKPVDTDPHPSQSPCLTSHFQESMIFHHWNGVSDALTLHHFLKYLTLLFAFCLLLLAYCWLNILLSINCFSNDLTRIFIRASKRWNAQKRKVPYCGMPMRNAYYQVHFANCLLFIALWSLLIDNDFLLIAYYWMQIAICFLRIAFCLLLIENCFFLGITYYLQVCLSKITSNLIFLSIEI